MRIDDSALLRAALIWDRPTLLRSDDPDARAFVRVLDLNQSSQDLGPVSDGQGTALATATKGLAEELGGHPDVARSIYSELAGSQDALVALSGLLLLAWMEDASEQDMDRVVTLLRTEAFDRDLISRSHAKLMTWALDQGWRDYARARYEDALESGEGDFLRRLQGVASWFSAGDVVVKRATDPTANYPWINDLVDYAARRAVQQGVIDSARSPWRRTRTFGGQPGREAQIADLQASWAGALWLLTEIRQQYGALIIGRTQSPDDLARGLAYWILGEGPDAERVIDSQESYFADDTARQIVVDHLREGRRVRRLSAYVSACEALWDEIPQVVVEQLIARLPIPEKPELFESTPRLLAVLLVRSPDSWAERFLSLPQAARTAIAANITPAASPFLPSHVREQVLLALLAGLFNDPMLGANNNNAWLEAATLLGRQGSDQELRRNSFVDRIPDYLVPLVAEMQPELVPARVLKRAAGELASTVAQDLEAARGGRYSGRFYEARLRYAAAVAALGVPEPSAVALLVQAATEPAVSREQRLGALSGIRVLVEAGLAQSDELPAVLEPLPSGPSFWDSAEPEDLIRVCQLAIAVQLLDSSEVEGDLLAASRSKDVEVRIRAVDASRSASKRRSSSALDAAQFGALYDPAPQVQLRGVAALAEGTIHDPGLDRAARERLFAMWPLAHRNVREGIARAARMWHGRAAHENLAAELLSEARKDRSWLVRNAAEEAQS